MSKWVLVAGIGVLYLIASFALVIGVLRHRDSAKFAPLDYKSPQHVLSPIVHPGDKLIVEGYKCNTSDKPVSVITSGGSPLIRNLDTQELTPRGGPRIDAYVRVPGCPLLHFENDMPPLVPGHYWLEGTDTATEGDKEQREAWNTDPFCVTASDGTGC